MLIKEMNIQKNNSTLKIANISKIFQTFFNLDLSINSVDVIISHLASESVLKEFLDTMLTCVREFHILHLNYLHTFRIRNQGIIYAIYSFRS